MKMPAPSATFDPAEWLGRATALGYRLQVSVMQKRAGGPFEPALYVQEPDRRAGVKSDRAREDQLTVDRWGGSEAERDRRWRALYDYLARHPEAGGLSAEEAATVRRQIASLTDGAGALGVAVV